MFLNNNFNEKWSVIREKGLLSFMVKTAFLRYGMTFFIVLLFVPGFVDNNFSFEFIHRDTFLAKAVILAVMAIFYSIIMGYSSWKAYEKRYRRLNSTISK